MILTRFVFFAAIILEILGSYMSVVGLSSKSSLVLIILAISLDFSKIIMASVIYKSWKELNIGFKLFLVPTTFFLMIITSYGAYAYLLQEFGKTTANQEQISSKLQSLEEESKKLSLRKKEIDTQIADVSPAFVTQKKKLGEMFAKELEYLNTRTIELDREIPLVKSSLMTDTLQAGTLGSLAKSWGTTPDQTAKIIALMMVIVIDPLAIVMLMVGNFLSFQYIKNKEIEKNKKILDQKAKEEKEFELKKLKIETFATIQNNKKDQEPQTLEKLKPKVETKQKNNWESSLPSVLKEELKKKDEKILKVIQEDPLDSELDGVMKIVANKPIEKKSVNLEDPFSTSDLDDMLNDLPAKS